MGDSIKLLVFSLFMSFLIGSSSFAEEEDAAVEKLKGFSHWVVVVHSSNKVIEITKSDLRKYLLKEKVFWSKDFKVVPLILNTEDKRFDEFTELFLKQKKSQYPRYWIEQKFTKGHIRPKEADPKTIVKILSILKGGITVIPKEDWNLMERPSVKEIKLIENDS